MKKIWNVALTATVGTKREAEALEKVLIKTVQTKAPTAHVVSFVAGTRKYRKRN